MIIHRLRAGRLFRAAAAFAATAALLVAMPAWVSADVHGGPDLAQDPGKLLKVLRAVPEAESRVALTFDAGWEYTNCAALLDALARRDVKATFFLRGQWAADHPDLARAIAAAGHQTGNHSLTHPDMTKLSWEDVRKEIGDGAAAIAAATGGQVTLFRPPYGAYNPDMLRLLAGRGYQAMIMWDVDSLDWTGLSMEKLAARVLSMVRPGSIVLMHIGGENTVKAMPAILDGLAARGLRPVTIDELLGYSEAQPLGHQPWQAVPEWAAPPASPSPGGRSPFTWPGANDWWLASHGYMAA